MSVAEDALSNLPAQLWDDAFTLSYTGSLGAELDRIWESADRVRQGFVPSTSHDDFGQLSLLERTFKLPVAPPGQSVAQRRSTLGAAIRGRNDGSGVAWRTRVSKLLGTEDWTFGIIAAYTIRVTVPFAPGTYKADALGRLLGDISPAHLAVLVASRAGFIVGTSTIGNVPL